ncbi:SpoIIE family protein phosphatase [Flocculibacter collagenilyticus]|uniref:SpoIIE family protein phosphatase n=1 Tax=Flocculibacter collagenilyticus TaxID=2744479 RepID=UPI0018F5D682|nr:SpoIIE family protein phosphatase [Flocculibacter collagenilyticus]
MKILVVDDQEIIRGLLRVLLNEDGYEVRVSDNGQTALAEFDEFQPDIILLDANMPVMDGYEAAPLLKQKAGNLYLPIIFLTGLDDDVNLAKCLAVGGDDFISKPVEKLVLGAKIRAHARIRELSRETNEQNKLLSYHQESIAREHEIVEHIFQNALQQSDTSFNDMDLHLSSASMFNGDIYLVAQSPLGSTYIMMGDFTGHGLPAATGALPVSRVFYAMVEKGLSVGDLAYEINKNLRVLLPDDMFLAATIAEISVSGRSLVIWAGGLPDGLLLDKQQKLKARISSRHMALGILLEQEFDSATMNFAIEAGEHLVLYTDGVTEAANIAGEMYGEQRFYALFEEKNTISVNDIIQQLKAFVGDVKQADDVSLAIIKCIDNRNNIEEMPKLGLSALPFSLTTRLTPDIIRRCDPILQLLRMVSTVEGLGDHRSTLFMLLSEIYNNALDHGLLGLRSKIKDQKNGFFDYYMEREERLNQLLDGTISLAIDYFPQQKSVRFCLFHNGEGYQGSHNPCEINHDSPHENCELSPSEQAKSCTLKEKKEHGRGLELVDALAESLQYLEGGNKVVMTYKLH